MSVYHSIRTVLPDTDDDDILLELGLESIHPHPAAERSPAHVSMAVDGSDCNTMFPTQFTILFHFGNSLSHAPLLCQLAIHFFVKLFTFS